MITNSIFSPRFEQQKMYKYSCKCGFRQGKGYVPGTRCPLCGTTIEAIEEKDMPASIISYTNTDLYHMQIGMVLNMYGCKWYISMAEKYCKEIHKIREQYDKYAYAISKIENNYRSIYNERMSTLGFTQEMARIEKELLMRNAEYQSYIRLAADMIGGTKYLEKAREKAKEIEDLKKQLSVLNDNMRTASREIASSMHVDFESMPEYKLMGQLRDMAFNYAKRIRDDYDKYHDYIKCIYGLTHDGTVECAHEIFDFNISEDDDAYIASINNEYISYEYYVSLANKILWRKEVELATIERSKARSIVMNDLGIMDYSIDTDPFTRHASRSIAEREMIDEILRGGSIDCISIF